MYKNMLSHIISFALGFAAGCTIKELIEKKRGGGHNNTTVDMHRQIDLQSNNHDNNTDDDCEIQIVDFSLKSISDTFNEYDVRPTGPGSFGILLEEIRSASYKSLLKKFLDDADTPEKMVEMLNKQTIPDKNFNLTHSVTAPYITKEQLDSYITEVGVSNVEFESNADKVRFLLSFYYAKGIDDFKNTLGLYLSEILSAHEKGDNVSELYESIMKIIKSRYEYLS